MDITNYRAYEKLKNDQIVLIRAIRKTDKQYLQHGLLNLSKQSVYSRFHGPKKELSEQELSFYTELDFQRHVGLIVIVEQISKKQAVAVGRYVCSIDNPPIKADLALTVKDRYQGIGIGTALFRHLILIARVNGVESMEADVLPENQSMLNILFHSGLPYKKFTTQRKIHVSLLLKK